VLPAYLKAVKIDHDGCTMVLPEDGVAQDVTSLGIGTESTCEELA